MTNTGILVFSTDLNDAEAPEPLPVGSYLGEITSAEWKVSQTSGNTYAAILFRIPAEQYPADYTHGDPEGTVLSYNRMPWADTAQARWRWRKFLQALGAPISNKVDPSDLLGLNARLEITHDEYEGERRAQISRVVTT